MRICSLAYRQVLLGSCQHLKVTTAQQLTKRWIYEQGILCLYEHPMKAPSRGVTLTGIVHTRIKPNLRSGAGGLFPHLREPADQSGLCFRIDLSGNASGDRRECQPRAEKCHGSNHCPVVDR